MIHIERKYHFYAAHRNLNAGAKCARIHGHTYRVSCIFEFESDGITKLFEQLDAVVTPILKEYDHYFLLQKEDPLCDLLSSVDELYRELPFETSVENLAEYFFTLIHQIEPTLAMVKISETESATVSYSL